VYQERPVYYYQDEVGRIIVRRSHNAWLVSAGVRRITTGQRRSI
jgi:hypothetical protein